MIVVPKRQPGRPRDAALRERRHDEILDTAARLFAEHGYAATDVQLVADTLGVGKGTVYRYFPSKEELFLATADRAMERMSAAIDGASERVAEPVERMEAALRAALAFLDDHAEFAELIIQERAVFKGRKKPTLFVHRDRKIGPWRNLFAELIAAGRVRGKSAERVLDTIGDLIHGAMFQRYLGDERGTLASQADDILDLVLYGILTPAERRRRGEK